MLRTLGKSVPRQTLRCAPYVRYSIRGTWPVGTLMCRQIRTPRVRTVGRNLSLNPARCSTCPMHQLKPEQSFRRDRPDYRPCTSFPNVLGLRSHQPLLGCSQLIFRCPMDGAAEAKVLRINGADAPMFSSALGLSVADIC
jgi:hypothetical protein